MDIKKNHLKHTTENALSPVENLLLILGLKWNFFQDRKLCNNFFKLLYVTTISTLMVMMNMINVDLPSNDDNWYAVFQKSERYFNIFMFIVSYAIMVFNIQSEIKQIKIDLSDIDNLFVKYGFSKELSSINARTKNCSIRLIITNLLFLICVFPAMWYIYVIMAFRITLAALVFATINIYTWMWFKICEGRISIVNKYLRNYRKPENVFDDVIMVEKLSYSLVKLTKKVNSTFNPALLFIWSCNYSVNVASLYLCMKMENKFYILTVVIGYIRNLIQIFSLAITGHEIMSKVSKTFKFY